MRMAGSPKELVLGCIQPRLIYLHNYFQIFANFSSFIWYNQGLGSYLCLSIRYILCLVLLSLDNLVSKTCLYSYHIDFPNNFLFMGILQVFCCPVILGAAVQLGC